MPKCILSVVGLVLAVAATILAAIVTKNDGKTEVPVIIVSAVAVCLSGVTLFFDYEDLGKMLAAGMVSVRVGVVYIHSARQSGLRFFRHTRYRQRRSARLYRGLDVVYGFYGTSIYYGFQKNKK